MDLDTWALVGSFQLVRHRPNTAKYSIALGYTCGDTTSVSMSLADLSDDADNVINFHAVFRDTKVAF